MSARREDAGRAPGVGVEREGTDSPDNTAPTPAPQQPGFVVIQSKENGREAVVGRYDDEATALSVARLLAWAGAVARIERKS